MNIDLTSKFALVTGGSKGIGRGIVETLIAAGAQVAILDRDAEETTRLVKELNANGPQVAYGITADVSNPDEVDAAVAAVVTEFGRLDLAVNNAGIAGQPGRLDETGPSNWRNVIGVNLDGVAYCLMAEARAMAASGGGAIVNTASVEAHAVLHGFTAYTASKHGILGLTKGAAVEFAPLGIRVNSVSPGVIRTPLTMAENQKEMTIRLAEKAPLARIGEPEDIARTVAFLLSDLSSFTTGTDLVVDGGFLLRE